MPEQNFPTFRNLLRGAICTRTQAQFANDSGISAEHLNRMLNANNIHRPSKSTLHKIAAAAKNGITYETLKKSLDSEDPSYRPEEGSEEEREERLQAAAQDFMPGFRERSRKTMECLSATIAEHPYPCITSDIPDHIGQLVSAAQEQDSICLPISYEVIGIWPYITGQHSYASKWMLVDLTMADSDETAETEMVIFYTDVPGAGQGTYAAIQRISTAPADLVDVLGMPPAAMATHRDDPEDFSHDSAAFEAAIQAPFYLEFGETQKFEERFVDTHASSREEALLHEIFGFKTEFTETTMGVGFWMECLPPKFLEFVEKHKDAIFAPYLTQCENYELLCSSLDEAIKNSDPIAFIDVLVQMEYTGTGDNDMGSGACIAEALSVATGFPFIFRRHTDPEDNDKGFVGLSDKDCIILPEADMARLGIHREPALLALGSAIQELGLETFGDILFTRMETRFRKPFTYRLRRPNEIERPEEMEPGCEPDYSVDFASGLMPEATGRYAARLKDGREIKLMYLKERGIWLFRNKEWSPLIEAYDPEPIWLSSDCPSTDEDRGDGSQDGADPDGGLCG